MNRIAKVAILDDYLDVLPPLADWASLTGAEVEFFRDHLSEEDAVAERLQAFDVAVGMRERTPFPASLIDRLPNLKLLVTLGMANPSFDLGRATEAGIVVCGTSGQGPDPDELTWGLILALARNIPREDAAARAGRWQTALGRRLTGNTLGILGLGKIGATVARIGAAFGMRVVAWSQNLTEERARAHGAVLLPLDQLLAESDFVTLHLRLGDRTRGIIGRHQLGLMKPTAFLVNTARSGLVDEAALIDALQSRTIAGAGLDVFDVEPLPRDHPLLALDNAVITPHLGGVTLERYRTDYGQVVDDIAAWMKGEPKRVLNEGVLARRNVRKSR